MTHAVRRVFSREVGEEDGRGGCATVEAGDGGGATDDGRAATVGRSVGRSVGRCGRVPRGRRVGSRGRDGDGEGVGERPRRRRR